MRSRCAVHTCGNQGKHLIPQDITLRNQWIRALRLNVDKTGRPPKKYAYICSNHFKHSDFITIPALIEGDKETKRLKNKAIPSIFPWTASQNIQPASILHVDIPVTLKTYSRTELPISFAEEVPFMALESNAKEDPLQLDNEDHENEEHYVENPSPIAHINNDNVIINNMDYVNACRIM